MNERLTKFYSDKRHLDEKVEELMEERERLLKVCGEYDAMAKRLMAEREDADESYRRIYKLYLKAIAERDAYKATLETYAKDESWWGHYDKRDGFTKESTWHGEDNGPDLARTALERGRKVREGE
jgi:hypothetical protein